jgi:YHS domain-containing protein
MLRKLLIACSLISFVSFAGVDTNTDANGVILAGHDAVAYFTEGKPVEGSAEFTAAYKDAIYRFSSASHRDKFNANPEKYEPAFGGYCATGTSFGKKFEVDGKAFEIVDGKLFVNKNEQVHAYWSKDITGNISKGHTNWSNIEDLTAAQIDASSAK